MRLEAALLPGRRRSFIRSSSNHRPRGDANLCPARPGAGGRRSTSCHRKPRARAPITVSLTSQSNHGQLKTVQCWAQRRQERTLFTRRASPRPALPHRTSSHRAHSPPLPSPCLPHRHSRLPLLEQSSRPLAEPTESLHRSRSLAARAQRSHVLLSSVSRLAWRLRCESKIAAAVQ